MKYKETIDQAWQFTQNNKKMILWFGFVPALLSTIYGIFFMTYQIFSFKASPLFDDAPRSFLFQVTTTIIDFVKDNFSLTIPLIVVAIIFLLMYFLLPVLFDAAVIQIVARRKSGQKVGLIEGLKYGILRFFPFFEFTLLIKTFSFVTIATEAAFILRNLGPEVFSSFVPVFVIVAIIALILHILFTFSEYYIVIDDEGVLRGIVKSCTLVILNLQKTFVLAILMLIILVRIIIQVLLVIVIPAFVIAGLAATNAFDLPLYLLIIIGIVSFAFLIFASYLAAVVHIFSLTVWTFTFIDFSSERLISAREKAKTPHPLEAPTEMSDRHDEDDLEPGTKM